MRRKGKSHKGMGHAQRKTISDPSRKTLKRCKNYEKGANIVLIDIDDDDSADNENTSDVPETLKQNLKGSSVPRNGRCQIPIVICIDEDDEISDKNQPGTSVEGADTGDASSSRFPSSSNQTVNFQNDNGDECQFLHEISPMKLSKCKRTYCAKAPCRYRYGLGPDSDCDLDGEQSDKDQLDSEYMEDTLGELRVLWENANRIRKSGVRSGESVKDGQFTASSGQEKLKVVKENKTGEYSKDGANLYPGKVNCKENTTSHVAGVGKCGCNPSFYKKTPFADSNLKSTQETKVSDSNTEQAAEKAKHRKTTFFREGAHCSFGPSSCSFSDNVTKQTDTGIRFSINKEKIHSTEHYFSDTAESTGLKFGNDIASYACEEAPVFRTRNSVDTEVGNGAPSCSYDLQGEFKGGCSNSVDKENVVCGEFLFQNGKPVGETRISDDLVENDVEAVGREYKGIDPPNCDHLEDNKIEAVSGKRPGKDPLWWIPDSRESKNMDHDKVTPVPKESFGNLLPINKDATEQKGAEQQEDKKGSLDDEACGDMDGVQDCLINDREKLKETDEYKQAEEKEWASRQEALRLQAEEAQRLRQVLKRKKAESLRLLDMERRQKQRLEEIRQTQKKDEENMNMKEKLRAEIRMGLRQLEMKSLDMGSLLRGLGVHVSGGLQPQQHEIRAAYKKALLSFHPDRAPLSDVRKLVEAEEKFKLISRMKEKFLRNS